MSQQRQVAVMSHIACSPLASSSSGQGKDMYIYEIPLSSRKQLCDHLDELNVWQQLAAAMSLQDYVQNIRRQQALGNSPTDELLKIWGGQYNHKVTELFVVLKRLKLYQGMRIIKDYVERKYHLYIPNSQPELSALIEKSRANAVSRKLLNYPVETSSGVSNSVSVNDTSDNNNSFASADHSQTNNMNSSGTEASQAQVTERNVKRYASSILEINYHELTEATNNWSDKFILGKGGFGTVYRGYWKHTDVAIKTIHYRGSTEHESVKVQLQQSLNELRYLNSCRHDNVLPLYGYCLKGDKPCLVYQLMKGGTLDQRLQTKSLPPLSWPERMNICLGVARGINYLHTFREKPLIHGDIKPANVLLDQCLHPKIGDFGLAREGPLAVNSSVEVTKVFGTRAYLPPEFLHSKKLSTQVDTYSFGVVLLETFTGMLAKDNNRSDVYLTQHIMKYCATSENRMEDLIDKKVHLLPGEEELCCQLIQLGIECIAENPKHRPEMEQVYNAIKACHSQMRQVG